MWKSHLLPLMPSCRSLAENTSETASAVSTRCARNQRPSCLGWCSQLISSVTDPHPHDSVLHAFRQGARMDSCASGAFRVSIPRIMAPMCSELKLQVLC
jgi:hypothetical protein